MAGAPALLPLLYLWRSTQRGAGMRHKWRSERERLANLLASYESGMVAHLEVANGQRGGHSTAERIAILKECIAYLDTKLAAELDT